MTITLEMRDDVAVFRYPTGYDGVVDEFDDLLEGRDTGGLGKDRHIAALEDLVARHPWFIDGHAHPGNAFFEEASAALRASPFIRYSSLLRSAPQGQCLRRIPKSRRPIRTLPTAEANCIPNPLIRQSAACVCQVSQAP